MRKSLILAVMILSLAGCGTQTEPIDRGVTEYIKDASYPDMHYNGKALKINDIKIYQRHDTDNFKYLPYCVVRIDLSNLTEEDIHYLTTADHTANRMVQLLTTVEYSSEANEISDDRMPNIVNYTDQETNERVYIYYDYECGAKKPLDDIAVDYEVEIVQDEKYEENGRSENKRNKYYYTINDDSENVIDIRDISEMPESEHEMFEEGLARMASIMF